MLIRSGKVVFFSFFLLLFQRHLMMPWCLKHVYRYTCDAAAVGNMADVCWSFYWMIHFREVHIILWWTRSSYSVELPYYKCHSMFAAPNKPTSQEIVLSFEFGDGLYAFGKSFASSSNGWIVYTHYAKLQVLTHSLKSGGQQSIAAEPWRFTLKASVSVIHNPDLFHKGTTNYCARRQTHIKMIPTLIG